ncbi:MAG: alpha/beta hydrolase [Brachymonas sp.]
MQATDRPLFASSEIGLDLALPEREREYSPSSAIGGNYAPYIQAYHDQSQVARAQLPAALTLRYGNLPREELDFFAAPAAARHAANQAGLLIFIHGGYWQELSKDSSHFLAPAWHQAGFAHAVVGYTLAPQASIAQIVQACVQAIEHLRGQAGALGFDASRMVVAGSSAGGYLAVACAAHAKLQIRGIVPISGIFDLRPLVGTSINDVLSLSMQEASELAALALCAQAPSVVAWGENETQAFKTQSQLFAARLKAQAIPAISMEIAQRNHFDVVHELGDTQSPLFQATLSLFN